MKCLRQEIGKDYHLSTAAFSPEAQRLRLLRLILLCGAAGYSVWWFLVDFTLPGDFNPVASRAIVVACFLVPIAASYVSRAVARQLDTWLAACCAIATAHYFYLFEQNHADVNWVIGSYIIVTAICAVLQTTHSLLYYSLFVASLSLAILVREPALPFLGFFPGMLTILIFANLGVRSRLRLLAQLEESRRRIESLFNAGFEGIAVHDGGTIREVNGALCRLSGYRREELLGRNIDELIVTADVFGPPHTEPATQESPYEAEALAADGSRIPLEVSGKSYVLNGYEMRLVAVRDLTARKRAEAALLLVNSDLESFSYSVAHDLRVPLRAIDGFSQILLEEHDGQLEGEGIDFLNKIRAAARRMGELIDDLLTFSRVSRSALNRNPCDLSRLARTVCDHISGSEPNRAQICTVQDGMSVVADARLVSIVFENLIGNSWKFTSRTPAARIEVGSQAAPGGPVFYVRDNGAGFDMRYVNKLFTPFQRLHDDAEFPGTGIGLAIVQRIVQSHGGRVWAESTEAQGATFYFTLQPS